MQVQLLTLLLRTIEACGAGAPEWQGLASDAAFMAERLALQLTNEAGAEPRPRRSQKRLYGRARALRTSAGACRSAAVSERSLALVLLGKAHAQAKRA